MSNITSDRPLSHIPMRKLDRPEPRIETEELPDGTVILRSGIQYVPGPESLVDYLELSAQRRPDTTFLAERAAPGWRRISYREAWRDSGVIATWLIRHGFGPEGAAVMILSENGIEHGLLTLGALRAGAAVVPVSPTYSFGKDVAVANEPSRLGYALDLIEPGLVFAKGARYAKALASAGKPGRYLVTEAQMGDWLREAADDAALSKRRAQIGPDTIAKILLTSGSTGRPKGAINTHGNLASGVQMARLVSESDDPNRIYTSCNWLPWHHTFGGNASFNMVMAYAGSLYIDDGRPLPGQFQATIENLREVPVTGFSCVPGAYGMLAEALERDDDLRRRFFQNVRWLSYGGALLPQPLWDRMQRVAVQELGERLPFGTGWGMTETAACGVGVYWNTERTGLIGLPLPGATLKLVPAGDRMEMRIKGPNVMPSYYRAPELDAQAFDEEGYFRTGDAVRWVDPKYPIEGLEFAGRIAEDFKLLSGTWVPASIIRRDLVEALQPFVSDAVICAPHRPCLGALIWLTTANSDQVRAALSQKLAAFNSTRQGSANLIPRLLVLEQPPSAEGGEITDKRSINQRRVLEGREADVAALYAEAADPRLILPATVAPM
jgi:feruloyl-CoA synthase